LVTSLGHEPHPVSPREVVDELLILLRGQLEQSKISVSVHDDAGDRRVPGDRDQIKQLLLNLCINAIEAMPSGGALAIHLGLIERAGDPRFVLQIADTGYGISDDIFSRIFDPFVTTKPHGSGLGLSICRSIVEAHRGTIRAERNADGRSTTFIVELPACRVGANTSAALRTRPRGAP
jgi:signal transduction histidine kinase